MLSEKNESGEIMVESVIVFSITIMVVFSLMNFAFFSYQRANLTMEANRAATEIANIYAMKGTDPFYGYVSLNQIKNRSLYRYIGITGWTSLDRKQMAKAKWYAAYLLEVTEYLHPESPDGSRGYRDDIQVSMEKNDFGFRQIKVDIQREYSVLAVNPFKYFGLDDTYTATATGYAQCYDMIDYINSEHAAVEIKKRIVKMSQKFVVVDLVENLAKAVNSIRKLFVTDEG